jgi:hypothetical protein
VIAHHPTSLFYQRPVEPSRTCEQVLIYVGTILPKPQQQYSAG